MSAPPNRAINNETDVARNSPKVWILISYDQKQPPFQAQRLTGLESRPFGKGQGFDPKMHFID